MCLCKQLACTDTRTDLLYSMAPLLTDADTSMYTCVCVCVLKLHFLVRYVSV